mmetsp:Transcript_20739/g.38589  ORF Transcript_20739/g.38589 Transcript_20739/m.38589 type:complete len:273 (+) Transcript_20739:437-1255(+)
MLTHIQKMHDYLYASYLGILRALGGLPLEHPFDYIKTQQQITNASAREVIRTTWVNHGMQKFYSGFTPSILRTCFKQAYRFPMMVSVPRMYRPFAKENAAQALAGLSIAIFESFIICPFERLKVWLMSRPKGEPISSKLLWSLLRGLQPVMLKQTVSWSTFMVSNSYFRRQFKKHRQEQDLSYSSIAGISVLVGITNTAATMPLDCVKSRIQSYGDTHVSIRAILQEMLSDKQGWKSKMKVLYLGWPARMCQFLVHAGMTVSVLETLEKATN